MIELVILEDSLYRMELFKDVLANVKYHITGSVREFLQAVRDAEKAGTLKLIVMDHDLGCENPKALPGGRTRYDYDPDGLCGTDAASMLQTDYPVLIWSANQVAAGGMLQIMQSKGMNAVYIPIWNTQDIINVFDQVFGNED